MATILELKRKGLEPAPKGSGERKSVMRASDIAAKDVEWLWRPYIPRGMVTNIVGDPEAGKGWVSLAVAAAVTTGGPLPGQGSTPKGRVLLVAAEDSPEHTLIPRMTLLEVDQSHVYILPRPFNITTPVGWDKLSRAVEEAKPALVVIDPITSYMGEGDTNKISSINELFGKLAALAGDNNCAILAVRHRRKPLDGDRKGRDPKFGGVGSIAFHGSARSEILVGVTADGQRAITHEKNSVGPHGPAFGFSLSPDTGQLKWEGEVELTGWDLTGEMRKSKRGRPASATAAAITFLQDFLRDGPEPAQVVIAEAERQGINKFTLTQQAKKPAGVRAFSREGQWWWTLEAE